MNDVTITPTDNGPYLIQGGVTLLDAEGNPYQLSDTIALCRCGHSSTKPFCDGSHEHVNFAAVSRAATSPNRTRSHPGERALDDPAVVAQPGAMLGLASCDPRLHAALPDGTPVHVVGRSRGRRSAFGVGVGPTGVATDGRHPAEQRDQLRNVVAVAAGERPGERDPAAVYEEVVLATGSAAINRARAGLGAPFFACR